MPMQRYDAPKTKLMALIIDGILNQKLPWSLVLIGALLAVSLELCMVPSLPFAVGHLPAAANVVSDFLRRRHAVDCRSVNPPQRKNPNRARRAAFLRLHRRRFARRRAGGVFEFQRRLAEAIEFGACCDRMFGEGMSSARWTTMTAFGVMLALLLSLSWE